LWRHDLDGQWWRIAREHGPFNWAFLPISGVIAVLPGLDTERAAGDA